MNHRIRTHRPALRLSTVSLVAAGLLIAPSSVAAGDSVRVDLLAAAGSSQAVNGKYRHGHGGPAPRDHRRGGHARGPKHRGYDRGYDYGHGHALRERAHHYATMAVRQAREARALGYYSDHPRWRTGYQRHYRWALQAAPYRIDEEIRRRARKLRELRSWGPGRTNPHYDPRYEYGDSHRHGPHCRH